MTSQSKFEFRSLNLKPPFRVALALIAGTAVSVRQAMEANDARQLADDRLTLANDRLESEQQARREADRRPFRVPGPVVATSCDEGL
jgi:hypothetical protein